MKICLDAGHGGRTTGATGKFSIEKDITLKLTLKLKDKLERNGVDIVLTRDSDVYVSLQGRCDIANNADCDYFLSIHCNGYSDPSANGTSTYHYPGSAKGGELARVIQDAAVEYNKNRDRGVKTAAFYVLKYTKMPAVLHETAFITNEEEEKMLNDSQWQEGITDAISNAVLEYVGITPSEPGEEILYRVYLDGVQKGAYNVKENALKAAEDIMAQIQSGNVKIVSSTGEVIYDKTKTPEQPQNTKYGVFLDGVEKSVFNAMDEALKAARDILESITSGNVRVIEFSSEVILDETKTPPLPEEVLYWVFLDGEQKGVFNTLEDAQIAAENILAEITGGNVKVIAYNSKVIFDRTKTSSQLDEVIYKGMPAGGQEPVLNDGDSVHKITATGEQPKVEDVSYRVILDYYPTGFYNDRTEALDAANKLLKEISEGRVAVITSMGEVILNKAKRKA